MTVPLVDRRIGREKIHIFFPLDIPDPLPLAPGDDHSQRVIIMRPVFIFQGNIIGCVQFDVGIGKHLCAHGPPPGYNGVKITFFMIKQCELSD